MTTSSSPDKSGANIQDTPENLTAGQMLRQARERLGLSLADVAAVTRVPRNMLEHLERHDDIVRTVEGTLLEISLHDVEVA